MFKQLSSLDEIAEQATHLNALLIALSLARENIAKGDMEDLIDLALNLSGPIAIGLMELEGSEEVHHV